MLRCREGRGYHPAVRDATRGQPALPALRRCDLHLHTRYSSWRRARILKARDSYTEPVEVFERAKAAGMDYVAITDHDSIEGALRLLDARPGRAAEIIVGEEVETRFTDTGQRLHVNVFGLDEATHRELQRLRGDVRDLVAYLRLRRLLFVLNHPFWSYRFQKRPRAYVEEIFGLFDHIEACNSTMLSGHAEAAEAMLRYAAALGLRKTAVGGSDAHVLDHVGSSYTSAPGDTTAEWLASVRRGDCRCAGSTIGFRSLLSQIYLTVGRYYAGLLTPEGRAGMGAVNYLAAAVLLPGATVLGVPAVLACLNEIKQRSILAVTRRNLERIVAAAAPAAVESPD
jgi:predicted metal-dependent phosphoesterase TrpH